MARRIVITSGKGGVGKTTITAQLGYQLASLGATVVLLDVDIGLNNLDIMCGIEDKIFYDIADISQGKCRTRQALIQYDKLPLLYFLPSQHKDNGGKVSEQDIKDIIQDLSTTFDYIILDCPAGIGVDFHRAVFGASEAIIVTTPHMTAIRDAGKVSQLLCGYDLTITNLVVNRARNDMMRKAVLSAEQIADSLKLNLLGQIPELEQISVLESVHGNILELSDKFVLPFQKLARNVHFGIDNNISKDKESGRYNLFTPKIKNWSK